MARARINVPTSAAMYDAALEGLTRTDEILVGEGRVPPLYDSGARYKTEPRETWRHAVDVATSGWGDCEDLSAYRAAELRVSGEDPSAAIKTYRTGPRRFHAIVSRNGGSLWEDPSKALGMKVNPKRAALYLHGGHFMRPIDDSDVDGYQDEGSCCVGEDPTPDDVTNITFGVMRLPGRQGFTGWLRIPIGSGQAILARMPAIGPAQAATPAQAKTEAQQAALNLAAALTKNPAIAKLMPPDSPSAITMANLGQKGAEMIANNPEALAAMGPYGAAAAAALQVPGVKQLFVGGGKMGDKLMTGTVGKIPGLKRLF